MFFLSSGSYLKACGWQTKPLHIWNSTPASMASIISNSWLSMCLLPFEGTSKLIWSILTLQRLFITLTTHSLYEDLRVKGVFIHLCSSQILTRSLLFCKNPSYIYRLEFYKVHLRPSPFSVQLLIGYHDVPVEVLAEELNLPLLKLKSDLADVIILFKILNGHLHCSDLMLLFDLKIPISP